MHFTAIGTHNRHFELFNDGDNSLGRLDYRSWFTIKADITLANGEIYTIDGTNLLNTKCGVSKDGVEVAAIAFDWLGHLAISYNDGREYRMKNTDFWSRHLGLSLLDEQLFDITRDFHIGNFSFTYQVAVSDHMSGANDPLLMLIAIYCANRLFHTYASGAV